MENDNNKTTSYDKIMQKFNWGAFYFHFIWGIFNKTWCSLWILLIWILELIFPIFWLVGFAFQIYLGKIGNKQAYQNKKWKSIDHFNIVQKRWAVAALIIFLITFTLFLLSYTNKVKVEKIQKNIIEQISKLEFIENFKDSKAISMYNQSIKNGTTKALDFKIKYRLSGITMRKSIINPYKNDNIDIDLSSNNAFMDYLLKTKLFTRKSQNTLVDEYQITYKFDCKNSKCDILVDINGDEIPNLLSKPNDGILSDQFKITIQKTENKPNKEIVEYITNDDGFASVIMNKKL